MATLVQQTTELFADSTSSIAPSITGVTAGNLVVMLVACSQNGTNTALTAPAGWSTGISTTGPASGTYRQQIACFYKENAASGSHSGTVTFNNHSYAAAVIVEFSGVKTTSSLDATNSSLATATTSGSTGNASNTTTNALVLAISCVSSDAGTMTGLSSPASSGYTNIDGELNEVIHTGYQFSYKNVSSVASQSGSWTWTNNANCAGAVVIFGDAGTAPVITTQPVQQTVASGATATFSVTATDATSYQWQINSSGTWTNVSTGTGGTTSSYTTGTLGTSDNGNLYRCQITNTNGTTNSAEVFVFLTNQPSASKGRRLSSTWLDHKSTTKGYTNPFIQLREYSRAENAVNPAASTAWNTWWFDAVASGVSGTLSYTNANDTSSAAGTTTVIGTLARTNANDTSAASGTTVVVGTLARTNANDTLSASGSVGSPVSGTLAYTNNNDTLAASGNTTVLATSSTTNANDTSNGAGSPVINGTVARTNNNDTLTANGTPAVVGSSSTTNANDTLAASGTAGATPVGTVNYTNQNDTSSAQGTSIIQGTLTRTNNNDTLTASGTAGNPVVGITTRLPMTGVGS